MIKLDKTVSLQAYKTLSLTISEKYGLMVLENGVLRGISSPNRKEITGIVENYIIRNSIICVLRHMLLG